MVWCDGDGDDDDDDDASPWLYAHTQLNSVPQVLRLSTLRRARLRVYIYIVSYRIVYYKYR